MTALLMFFVGVMVGGVFGLLAGWAAALSDIERWPRPRLDHDSGLAQVIPFDQERQ